VIHVQTRCKKTYHYTNPEDMGRKESIFENHLAEAILKSSDSSEPLFATHVLRVRIVISWRLMGIQTEAVKMEFSGDGISFQLWELRSVARFWFFTSCLNVYHFYCSFVDIRIVISWRLMGIQTEAVKMEFSGDENALSTKEQ
jgi:hypothetical protein